MILPQSMLAELYNYIAIFNYAWINQKQNKNRPPMSLHFLDGSLSCQLTKLSHEKKLKKTYPYMAICYFTRFLHEEIYL
jgi:hypothetical protein